MSCLRFAVLKENQCRGGPPDSAAAKQHLRLLSGLMHISEGPQGPATETIFALALVFLLLCLLSLDSRSTDEDNKRTERREAAAGLKAHAGDRPSGAP